MTKLKIKELTIIAIVCGLLYIINPFEFSPKQNIVFSCLCLTVASWATNAVHKSVASIFLIAIFILFSNSEPKSIISFAYSPTMLLIVSTTLLSVGIMNSGILNSFVSRLFIKSSRNLNKMLILPYLLGLLLILAIPQAFARSIIVGAIFNGLITAHNSGEAETKSALLFNVFMAISMTYMVIPNGDIVLNHAAIKFSGDIGTDLFSIGSWTAHMAIPTIISCVVVFFITKNIFKKEFSRFNANMISSDSDNSITADKKQKTVLIILMTALIAIWMTESVHSIKAWIPATIIVILMFGVGILKKSDLKHINPHFLLFLTAAFSIGKALSSSGITSIIFESLKDIIPVSQPVLMLIGISVVTMVLHSFIGSAVATMSVVLPILLPMAAAQSFRPDLVTYVVYATVNMQFLLPFHHANMMIGVGKNYYTDKHMLRFGTVMTIITPILIAGVFLTWWSVLGYINMR